MHKKCYRVGVLKKQITKNIKEIRKGKGISQGDLAERVNTAKGTTWVQTTVYRIESNQRPLDIEELEAVAEALGVSMSYIMKKGDEEEEAYALYLEASQKALEAYDHWQKIKNS